MSAEPRNEDEPRDTRLSQLYRESGAPEPSAAIDQAILAAARREVHARPRRIGAWLHEWRVPVSIAATLVVSASLVMVVVEEGGNRMEEAPPAASVPALKESPPPEASATDARAVRTPPLATPGDSVTRAQDAPSQVAGARAQRDLATRDAPNAMLKHEAGPDVATPRRTPSAQPAPPPALARPFPEDTPASRAAPAGETEQRAAPAREPAAPRAAQVPLRDAQGNGGGGSLQFRRESAEEANAAAPGASRPDPGARGSTESPPAERAGDSGPGTHAQEWREAPAGPRPAAPAAKRMPSKIQAAPKPASRGAVLARGLMDQAAEKWLERVEQLRREERHGDAEALMVEFRRRFPDHPAAQRAP